MTLRIASADVDPAEVDLEFELPAAGIGPITRAMVKTASGEFRWQGQDLLAPGDWTLGVRIRISDFERLTLRTLLPLYAPTR